ncbi:MAG: cupredoxin domain-containing protein [Dehalococcoidia bacterium]
MADVSDTAAGTDNALSQTLNIGDRMNLAINQPRRLFLIIAVFTIAFAAAGYRAIASADDYSVEIIEPSFDPQTWGYSVNPIVVKAGDTVSWVNTGVAPHSVTAYDGSFDSGIMVSGAAWTFTATTPGEFGYYCTLHPDMVATLIVEG